MPSGIHVTEEYVPIPSSSFVVSTDQLYLKSFISTNESTAYASSSTSFISP
ncbi:MAG: hypothetical protein ACTSRP_18120 [Candidatus Helarchaeota archaeon]